LGAVGRLRLGGGTWVLFSKASIDVPGSDGRVVGCGFARSQDSAAIRVQSAPEPSSDQDITRPQGVVAGGYVFLDQGHGEAIHLDCASDGSDGDARVRDLRITAMAAGTLVVHLFDEHTNIAIISGGPYIRESIRDEGIPAGPYQFEEVSFLDLPEGRWAIHATFTMRQGTSDPGDGDPAVCRLVAPGRVDGVDARLAPLGSPLDRQSYLLTAGLVLGSPAEVRLECRAGGSEGLVVSGTDMQAVALGTLVRVPLAGGPRTTSGSGGPRAVFGRDAGPVDVPAQMSPIRGMRLAQGGWLVRASALASNQGPDPVLLDCELGVADDTDHSSVELLPAASPGDRSTVVLTTVQQVGAGGTDAVLSCGAEGSGGTDATASLANIRFMAIRQPSALLKPLT
jgi:hypothetical protein